MHLYAIEHALVAGNHNKAMQLIDIIIENLWENAQYATILKFGSLFNEKAILSNKRFCIIYAWTLTVYGKLNDAEEYLEKVKSSILNNNEGSNNSSILGKLYLTYNLLNVFS